VTSSDAGAPSTVGAPRYLVLLLAAFTSLVVLTTDVYLPVLPQMSADLGVSDAVAAATVSMVLIGIAAGQIVVGPLSDAVGRRGPLLLGALAYALTHVLSAIAPNGPALLTARALAGLATAAVVVTARAVVADVFHGPGSARAYATLGAVMAIAPVVAPVLGGLLANVMSWRGMFLVLAGLALVLAAVGWRALPETLPPDRRVPPHLGAVLADLGSVLRIRRFLAYVAVIAAFGALLFGYIGASSFVLQEQFDLGPTAYSLVFAANSVGIFVLSNVSRHLVSRVEPGTLLGVGHLVSLVGVVLLGLGVGASLLWLVLLGLLLAVSALGLIMPAAQALGMAEAPGRAGSASGVIGISQFTVGAIASPLAGLGGSAWSFVAVLAAGAVAGPVLLRLLLHGTRPTTSLERS
jgi:DHA1 family bicyclomycin/chloramphenicol resistance-like MFS transporter